MQTMLSPFAPPRVLSLYACPLCSTDATNVVYYDDEQLYPHDELIAHLQHAHKVLPLRPCKALPISLTAGNDYLEDKWILIATTLKGREGGEGREEIRREAAFASPSAASLRSHEDEDGDEGVVVILGISIRGYAGPEGNSEATSGCVGVSSLLIHPQRGSSSSSPLALPRMRSERAMRTVCVSKDTRESWSWRAHSDSRMFFRALETPSDMRVFVEDVYKGKVVVDFTARFEELAMQTTWSPQQQHRPVKLLSFDWSHPAPPPASPTTAGGDCVAASSSPATQAAAGVMMMMNPSMREWTQVPWEDDLCSSSSTTTRELDVLPPPPAEVPQLTVF